MCESQQWALDGTVILQKAHACDPTALQCLIDPHTGNHRPLKIKACACRDNVHLRLNKEDLLLLFLSQSPRTSQAFCTNLFKSCELGLVMLVWKVKLHGLYNAQLIIWTGICLAWQAAGTAGFVKSGTLYVCVTRRHGNSADAKLSVGPWPDLGEVKRHAGGPDRDWVTVIAAL